MGTVISSTLYAGEVAGADNDAGVFTGAGSEDEDNEYEMVSLEKSPLLLLAKRGKGEGVQPAAAVEEVVSPAAVLPGLPDEVTAVATVAEVAEVAAEEEVVPPATLLSVLPGEIAAVAAGVPPAAVLPGEVSEVAAVAAAAGEEGASFSPDAVVLPEAYKAAAAAVVAAAAEAAENIASRIVRNLAEKVLDTSPGVAVTGVHFAEILGWHIIISLLSSPYAMSTLFVMSTLSLVPASTTNHWTLKSLNDVERVRLMMRGLCTGLSVSRARPDGSPSSFHLRYFEDWMYCRCKDVDLRDRLVASFCLTTIEEDIGSEWICGEPASSAETDSMVVDAVAPTADGWSSFKVHLPDMSKLLKAPEHLAPIRLLRAIELMAHGFDVYNTAPWTLTNLGLSSTFLQVRIRCDESFDEQGFPMMEALVDLLHAHCPAGSVLSVSSDVDVLILLPLCV